MITLLLFLFVLVAALAPSVKLAEGVPLLRPEMVVVVFAFAARQFRMLVDGDVPKLLGAFAMAAAVAIGASYTVFGVPYDRTDFSIFPMLVQYWLVYCFGVACMRKGLRQELLWAVVLGISLTAAVALLQKLNLFGVNTWLTPLYIQDEVRGMRTIGSYEAGNVTARAIGTVGDPRHCAMMIGFGVSAAMALLLGAGRVRGRLLLVGALGIMAAGMLVTYSRTGIFAAALATGVGFWLVVRRGGSVLMPLSVGVAALLAVAVVSSRLEVVEEDSRLTMSAEEMVATSGYARIRDTLEPFQKSLQNPLILITGMGPSKAVLPGSEHGETGWLVLRYGLVGFFIYLTMVKRGILRGWLVSARGRAVDAMVASFVLQGITVWMVFFLAESIFKLSQIMSVNMLLLAAAAGLRLPSESHAHSGAPRVIATKAPRGGNRTTKATPPRDVEEPITDPDLQL